MSFILDALKKVEQEKRVDPQSVERAAVSGRSGGPRGQLWAMTAIALASAGLTAGLLGIFLKGGGAAAGRTSPEETVVEATSVAARAAPAQEATAAASPEATPPVPPVADPAAGVAEPGVRARDEAPRVEEAEAAIESSPPVEAPSKPDPEPEPEPESAMPVNIVGRESAALETMRRAETRSTAPEDDSEKSPGESAPPEGLPELVLQGTSVLDGAPVAVISEQRVFEGDRIEGAMVVKISEREVELVFEGHRFTLTL